MFLGALFVLVVGPLLFAGVSLGAMGLASGVIIVFDLFAGLVLAGLAGFIL